MTTEFTELSIKLIELVRVILEKLYTITWLFFSDNVVYFVLFVGSLVYIRFHKKSIVIKELLFSFVLLAIVLVIYNPILALLFDKLPVGVGGAQVFARFWLIIPVWIIIAYSSSVCVMSISNKAIRSSIIVLIVLLLIVTGNSISRMNMVNQPTTIYKIRKESIDLVDTVLMINNEEPTSLFVFVPKEESDGYVNGGEISSGIDQYSGMVRCGAYFCSDELWNDCFISDSYPDGYSTNEQFIDTMFYFIHYSYGFDYVAIPSDQIVDEKIIGLGHELVGNIDNYSIYRLN